MIGAMPIASMGLVYLPTFTIEINQMQVDIPYMDSMGWDISDTGTWGITWVK